MQLSARRARAAVAYLVKKGIAPGRLVARGYGETRLVNKCAKGVKCTEAAHQANRRTEVKILEQE
jgi:outer membrane protein OmpA-like peptidoglycan-associated protein